MNIYEQSAQSELQLPGLGIDWEFHKPRFDKVLEWIELIKPKSVMDVGCGWGYILDMLSKYIETKDGIDISPTKVGYCRGKGFNVSELSIGNSIGVLRWNKGYDLVIAMELLEHFNSPFSIACNCTYFCNRNGHIIFSTPVYENIEEAVDGKSHLVYILPEDHLLMSQKIGKVRDFLVVKSPNPLYGWTMSLVETW